jgi:hypothetical protein
MCHWLECVFGCHTVLYISPHQVHGLLDVGKRQSMAHGGLPCNKKGTSKRMVPSPGERLSSYRLSASSCFYPRFWPVTESPIQNEQTIQGMLRSRQEGRWLMNRRPTLDMSGGRRPQAGGGLLDGMVQVSRSAAGAVPVDAPIRPTSF